MADEKIFTIPLRKAFLKVAKFKRAKKSVSAVRVFIQRHMKVEEALVGVHLNNYLWSRGGSNPPTRVKVKAVLEEKHALVELPEFPFNFKKEKKEEKKGLAEKILGKKDAKPEVKKEDLKTLAKEEIKEQKKEHKPKGVDIPAKELKQNAKIEENTLKYSKVIPDTGRKDSHEGKP